MYRNNSNKVIEISLSVEDLFYITERYKAELQRYKEIVEKYLKFNI